MFGCPRNRGNFRSPRARARALLGRGVDGCSAGGVCEEFRILTGHETRERKIREPPVYRAGRLVNATLHRVQTDISVRDAATVKLPKNARERFDEARELKERDGRQPQQLGDR